jgi:hypothetical protein
LLTSRKAISLSSNRFFSLSRYFSHSLPFLSFPFFEQKNQANMATATSQLGFGCMGMTAFYGEAMSDEAAVALLKGGESIQYNLEAALLDCSSDV